MPEERPQSANPVYTSASAVAEALQMRYEAQYILRIDVCQHDLLA